MAKELLEIMEVLQEPMLISESGEIIVANTAAEKIGLQKGKRVPEQFSETVDKPIHTSTEIDGIKYEVKAVNSENQMIYTLIPSKPENGEEKIVKILKSAIADIRDPLQLISAAAEYLMRFVDNSENVQVNELSSKLNLGIYKLRRLCGHLEAFTWNKKYPKKNSQRFDLVEVCSETVYTTQSLFSGRDISFFAEQQYIFFVGDKEAIESMLLALIGNALRHAGDDAKIKIKLNKTEKEVVITVSDNGAGIPLDMKDKLWEWYMSDDLPVFPSGAGFGLPFVRAVAESHGGSAYKNSESDETEFIVQLPLNSNETAVHGTTRAYNSEGRADNGAKIELADILPASLYELKFMD